jgi:hypothetical protein
MDYGFENTRSLPMLLRQKNREFNGKVLLAEQVTDSTYQVLMPWVVYS